MPDKIPGNIERTGMLFTDPDLIFLSTETAYCMLARKLADTTNGILVNLVKSNKTNSYDT